MINPERHSPFTCLPALLGACGRKAQRGVDQGQIDLGAPDGGLRPILRAEAQLFKQDGLCNTPLHSLASPEGDTLRQAHIPPPVVPPTPPGLSGQIGIC